MFDNPRIEESPQRQPGYCRGCRATSLSREWIMDLDIDDEDHPGYAIQLCNYCIQRIAELAGYQKFDLLKQMNTERIEELEQENEQLRRVDRVMGLLGLDSERLIRIGVLAGLTDPDAESANDGSDSESGVGESRIPEDGGTGEKGNPRLRVKREKRTVESSDDEDVAGVRGGSVGSDSDGDTSL